MNKKSRVKISNMRFLYYGLIILFSCLALWLLFSEGKQLHSPELKILPLKQTFILRAYSYIILAFGMLGMFLYFKNNRKERNYAKEKLLELAEDANNQAAFAAGKQWFLVHDRRRYWNRCLELFLICVLSFSFFRECLYEWAFLGSADGIVSILLSTLAVAVCVISLKVYWGKKYMEILIKENRPITAAFAFLMEAAHGFYWSSSYYKKQVHNAAIGLARGGRYIQAIELADYGWNDAREKKLMRLAHSGLLQSCFLELGRKEEADSEFAYQKQLIKTYPILKRMGEAGILLAEIRNAYMARKFGQVEAYVNIYCEHYPEAYYSISIMFIQMKVYEETGEVGKIKDICDFLLSYSPENAAVREAMRYGVCTYTESSDFLKDKTGRVCRIIITGVAVIYAMLGSVMLKEIYQWRANETIETKQLETKQEPSVETMSSQGPGFEMNLPKDWNGLIVRKEFEDGVSYHQKKSYDLTGDGDLFYIQSFSDGSYVNLPDYEIWGYDGPRVYVMSMPTDVTFYMEDDAIMEEYQKLKGEVSQIRETFRIQSDNAKYDGYEFIFPNSSSSLLQEPDLWNLSASQLRIAKNEIYARHGRRFNNEELERYFSQCSWYEGTVSVEDFNEQMLNEIEQANIRLIQEQQKTIE